ncbi:hypothetical protein RB614_06195 [Phytohabitans sp. ZYX-F-186]|uniref:Uncharacterized protein n=1 Tax=Phytohabitans maris TaxID=3071409 RepID=A0ABU0ZAL9_9ACTN|nr:hypothetical protein [Phytohabitans sp. ZYX-F-186]MDQ7904113.1 hypothetical protein [Phytohabitans sp. ZYX-F-186]
MLGKLGSWIKQKRETLRLAREAKQLLGFGEPDLYSYRVAMHHPLYKRGEPHPDDLAAFVTMAGYDIARAHDAGVLAMLDRVEVSLDDGLVLIGSPEAEAVTRLAFGYTRKAGAGGMRFVSTPVKLPYRWEEDRTLVSAQYERFVPGAGRARRPNWPIIDETSGSARPIFPVVSNSGLLHTDLLLITKVPNFLTPVAYESGRSLVSVAGAHGPGTRSVELLLNDRRLLGQIREGIPEGAQAFQVLLDATDIRHDPRSGSIAKTLRVRDIKVFERPEATWRSAMRESVARRSSWLAELGRE